MAEIQDEISIGEQQVISIPNLTIQSSNLTANFNCSVYPKPLQIIIECLKYSELARAMTIQRVIPQRLVNMAFSKAIYMKDDDMVTFEALGGKTLHIKKKSFIRLMGLSTEGTFVTPSTEQLINMFNQMGFNPFMTKISQFKKNKLPFLWNFYFTMFKRCLCGRKSGLDAGSQLFLTALYGVYYDVKVDFGSILWFEFIESLKISTRATELSSHRFWSVIVHTAYTLNKIPYDESEDPKMIIHELQVPGKLPSQKDSEFVGSIPQSMLNKIPLDSEVLRMYTSETSSSTQIRKIPDSIIKEIQDQFVKPSVKRKESEGSSQGQIVQIKKKAKSSKSTVQMLLEMDDDDMVDDLQIESQSGKKKVVKLVRPPQKKRSKLRKMVLNDEEEEHGRVGENLEIIENEEVETEKFDDTVKNGDGVEVETEKVGSTAVDYGHVDSEQHVEIVTAASVENIETEKSASDVIADILTDLNQSTLNTDVEKEIVEQNVTTVVSEVIHSTESESSIFVDLQNLNVSIPLDSPVIPQVTKGTVESPFIPSVSEQQTKELMFENVAFTEDNLEFEIEDLEMAPIDLMDDENDDENENELMSIKQFKILNRKLNMILRFSERPADLSTSRESDLEKVSLEWNEKFHMLNEKMNILTERFDGFKTDIQRDNNELRNEITELKVFGKSLEEELIKIYSTLENLTKQNVHDFKVQIAELNLEKSTLQKALDDALSHIKFLEPSLRIYDQKELADEYNEKVVQHVELVQKDFIARFAPLQNLLSRLPKVSSISQSSLPIQIPPFSTKPYTQMNIPLFPISSHQMSISTSDNISVPNRIIQHGVVIGSNTSLMTTSTIVSTQEGSSIGKGKEVFVELTKEEQKLRFIEERDKRRQQLSLMRQGEMFTPIGFHVNKIWTEDTIKNIAFGEDIFVNFLPKQTYNTMLKPGTQLDLPIIPKLFTVKCFKLPSSLKLSSKEYNEKLIRFYGTIGMEEEKVWSLYSIRKIIKVDKEDVFDNIFPNYTFHVQRGDSKPYVFTLADFPVLNPMDLIQILKLLHLLEKVDVSVFINHIRMLLQVYVNEFATQDMELAKALGKDISGPISSRDGLSKIPDGKIVHKPEWGIVFSSTVNGKKIKRLFRIDDRGKFTNAHILAILKRIVAFDGNGSKETIEVNDLLNWTMAVRKELLEAIPIIFNRK